MENVLNQCKLGIILEITFIKESIILTRLVTLKKEKELLSSVSKYIVGISIWSFGNAYNYEYSPAQLEIVERPSSFRNYYVIEAYNNNQKLGLNNKIYIGENNIYIIDNKQRKIPLKQAIISSLEKFTQFKDRNIPTKTIQIAQQELQKLKSHP